tara:strand:+ start:439 stop:1332 length:894 start_codon:yes stop_codon:yes gene_type:complete
LLSISQNEQNFFCIEWIPSEIGPNVLRYKKIKFPAPENNYKNFLDDILSNINIDSQNDSNTLTLSLDINNIGLTSFNYDPLIPFQEYKVWYEDRILGPYVKENYDIYYYNLHDTENTVMVIYISKLVKKNILDSCKKNKYRLLHLGVDIFSANFSTNMFGSQKYDNYVLWKILKNNFHMITYYEKGILKHVMKIKKTNSLETVFSIGDKITKDKLEKMLYKLLINQRKNSKIIEFDQVYIYQNKTDSSQIKKIKIRSSKKIKIMDIGSSFLRKKVNKIQYNLLPYNENGNSLRGIDV